MRKWIISMGLVLGIFVVFAVVSVWRFLNGASGTPSNIVDFRPVSFVAHSKSQFFYSVGKTLKYGDVITSDGPKLFDIQSSIRNPMVSPDNTMLAFVDNWKLLIVGRDGVIRTVTAVDTIYSDLYENHRAKPLGHDFFRDQDFQWTSDSRALYLIRDQFYDSVGSQLYSKHGELWKYDLDTGSLSLVLRPFEAYQFFFGMHGIYFSVPTAKGDLQLLYFDGKQTVDVGTPDESLSVQMLQPDRKEQIFYSFDTVLDAERFEGKVNTKTDDEHRLEHWTLNGNDFLSVTQGENIKGPYYCGDLQKTRYLPGREFAFLSMDGCENFDGELLLDLSTGRYSTLPKDTRIFLVLNTNNAKNYKISGGGISLR